MSTGLTARAQSREQVLKIDPFQMLEHRIQDAYSDAVVRGSVICAGRGRRYDLYITRGERA